MKSALTRVSPNRTISPRSETPVIGEMMIDVKKAIPEWFARLATRTGAFCVVDRQHYANAELDWVIKLRPTDSAIPISVLIEARQRVTPQEFLGSVNRLKRDRTNETLVLCSASISPRVAQLCRETGVGFLDGAGNCHIQAPGLFIHIEGRPNPYRHRRKAVDPFAKK